MSKSDGVSFYVINPSVIYAPGTMSDDPGQIDAPFASAESALDDYDEQYSQGGSFDDFNISLIERCSDLESWLNGRGDDGDFVPEDLSDEPELLTDPHLGKYL